MLMSCVFISVPTDAGRSVGVSSRPRPLIPHAVRPRSRKEWLQLHNLPTLFRGEDEELVPEENFHSEGTRNGNAGRETVPVSKEKPEKKQSVGGDGLESFDKRRNGHTMEGYQASSPGAPGHWLEGRRLGATAEGGDGLQSSEAKKLARWARRKEKLKIWRELAKTERDSRKPVQQRQSLELSYGTPKDLYSNGRDPEEGRLVGTLREPGSNAGEPPEIVEVWRNGKLKKRYVPLGVEFLYGRTKPTRLYGPLNTKGEVPGSGLAPVPHKYRSRCDDQNGWTIKEVVSKILELNHWDDIDFILNHWVGRYNRKNFPPLMMAMTRTGALKHSVRLFTWMKAQRCYRSRSDIYNLMIWLYARHNRVDRARSLFKEMQEYGCKPDLETYNALISVHGRARQWQESLRFLDRMLRAAVPPGTDTYNMLINACGCSGRWQKALEMYEKMKVDGIEMDVVTHNTLLTALKIGQQYTQAVAYFEKMLGWGIAPSRVTLNIIISCFCNMGKHDEAVQLFNSMRSLKYVGCKPDLVTYTTVMHVYAGCGQVDNVRAVFDMMGGEGIVPNIVSWNILIGVYASFGMDAEALETFDNMGKVGFEPDVVSYTTLMNAYSKAGKPDEAIKVFDLMKRKSRKPNIVTYNTLIDALSTAGRVTEALALLPEMDINDVLPTVVTMCSLIVACGRSGEIETVRDVLKVAAARRISLNVNVCNTAMSIYLNGGMYKEAKNLYTAMKEEEVHPDAITFAILINGATKVGNLSGAQEHFNEMLSLKIGSSVEPYSALIHAYAEQGLPKEAHAILVQMKEADCAPNVMTYTSLIHAYSTAGLHEGAIAVFEEVETMELELDAVICTAMFSVYNQCGQTHRTLTLWSKWRGHLQFSQAAYTHLSRACSMLRDWRTAMHLFEEMVLVGVMPDSITGDNLLRSLGKSGKIEELEKVFWQLQDLGTKATKDTYNILIECYSRAQNWRQCLEVFGRFEFSDMQPDLKTYTMVLRCLENAQHHEKYLEIYNDMTSKGYFSDSVVSKVMLDAFKETGQERRVQELDSIGNNLKQEKVSILREAVDVFS